MSRTMTLAIERIADDRRFARRFRSDPDRALSRYRLDRDQIEAIKFGDPESLARHGVDVLAFERGRRHGWRPHWRRLVGALAVGGVALMGLGSPARADNPRFVHGVRRASARQELNGRAIRVGDVLLERSSVRAGLRRAGIFVRAQGRTGLREALGIACPKGCFIDVVDGDPVLLAGD